MTSNISLGRILYAIKNKLHDSIVNIDENTYDKLADLQFKNDVDVNIDNIFSHHYLNELGLFNLMDNAVNGINIYIRTNI